MACPKVYIGESYESAPANPEDNPEFWPRRSQQPTIYVGQQNVKINVRARNNGLTGATVNATLYHNVVGDFIEIGTIQGVKIDPRIGGADGEKMLKFIWSQAIGLPQVPFKLRVLVEVVTSGCHEEPQPPVEQSKLCGERFITLSAS